MCYEPMTGVHKSVRKKRRRRKKSVSQVENQSTHTEGNKYSHTHTHTHTLKLTKKRVKIVRRVDGIYCTLLIMYE